MSYGYCVWLVYNQNIFKTLHIAHITIMCFMTKTDALSLQKDIQTNIKGLSQYINVDIHCDKPFIFDDNYYGDIDKNNLKSWGYNVTCNQWDCIKNISKKYKGSLPDSLHTSIQYSYSGSDISMKSERVLKNIPCVVCVSDARDEDFKKWNCL